MSLQVRSLHLRNRTWHPGPVSAWEEPFIVVQRFLPFAAEPRIPFPPVVVLNELVGLRAVRCFHVAVIPLELLAGAEGDIAEEDGLA